MPMQLREWLLSVDKRPEIFAREIGVDRGTIYRYLSGKRLPSREVMERIAVATNGHVMPNDLLGIRSSNDSAAA